MVFRIKQKFLKQYKSKAQAKQSYEKTLDELLASKGLKKQLSEIQLETIKDMRADSEEEMIIVTSAALVALLRVASGYRN